MVFDILISFWIEVTPNENNEQEQKSRQYEMNLAAYDLKNKVICWDLRIVTTDDLDLKAAFK